MNQPLSHYSESVKKTLVVHYTNHMLNRLPADEFVDTLARMFRLKIKMINNIAKYVKNEVEVRGHPLDRVLASIGFFAVVFVEYIHKDNGQPIHKYYTS